MKRNFKILIIGYGSIGQRHYKNLLKLGYKSVYVYDILKRKIRGLKTVNSLSLEILKGFKIVLICNPTNLHIKTALKCAQAGCHLFIEKPLSNSLAGTKELEKICQKKKLVNMVACNMRFEPAINKIKSMLDKKFLGKVYTIYLEYGRYLPYQRPGVDYRKVYAANKKMGGGIILDNIHEFDLLFWFNNFKKIKKINFVYDTLSNLKIDVEDICNASIQFKNGLVGNIRCDYLQQYKHRNLKIIGAKGNLVWEFRNNLLWFEYYKNRKEIRKKIKIKGKSTGDPYLKEIKYFLDCVAKKKRNFNDIATSLHVLKIVLRR